MRRGQESERDIEGRGGKEPETTGIDVFPRDHHTSSEFTDPASPALDKFGLNSCAIFNRFSRNRVCLALGPGLQDSSLGFSSCPSEIPEDLSLLSA